MTQTGRHILLLAFLAQLLGMAQAHAEPFADFLVRFLSAPGQQAAKTSPSFTLNGKKTPPANNLLKVNTNSMAILCADSVNTPVAPNASPTLFALSFPGRAGNSYTFAPSGRSYLLKEARTLKENVDYDFLTFLAEYSHNHDFQIKRTIFPIPLRHFKGGTEGDSKLLMPREWDYLDFGAIAPQIYLYNNLADANNRRLYIYNRGKLGKIYNFISINRKWFLIEVENH